MLLSGRPMLHLPASECPRHLYSLIPAPSVDASPSKALTKPLYLGAPPRLTSYRCTQLVHPQKGVPTTFPSNANTHTTSGHNLPMHPVGVFPTWGPCDVSPHRHNNASSRPQGRRCHYREGPLPRFLALACLRRLKPSPTCAPRWRLSREGPLPCLPTLATPT